MIFSYDFENDIRNVTPALEVIRKNNPTLFTLAAIGAPVTNRNAEWIDKSLGIKFIEASEATSGSITVPDGSIFAAGMLLSPIDSADNYIVQSVAGNILTVAKADASMADPTSGTYEVSYGSVIEGSTEGAEIFWEGQAKLNNTEIFRSEAKLTRTAMGTSTYDNANLMETQVEAALFDIYHQINRALWKGYKKLGSQSTAGKLGGIYQFCNQNIVDASGAAISDTLINKLLKKLKNQGSTPNALVCNTAQIAAINAIYKDQIILTQDLSIRGVYVNKIRNPYDGTILTVITDDLCPTNDIWIFDANKLEVAYFINGALTDKDTTPAGFDGARRSIIGLLTAKFHNAGECFGSIRNLG